MAKGWVKDLYGKRLKELLERGEYWEIKKLMGPTGPHAIVEGKEVIMFATNNYLNLANDQRLKQAAVEAIEKYGWGPGAVWAIAGFHEILSELEKKIAEFKRTEAGIFFPTGYATNVGTIPTLVETGDLILSDQLNHGSIIDGIRLSRAEKIVYNHCDVADLEDKLRKAHGKYNKILIITDGVFSMDGDIAPLKDISKLAEEYNAIVYVDDAHGEGVLGEGRGTPAHFGVDDKIDIHMGTFSKALGSSGGMVGSDREIIEYVRNTARSWLLSTGPSPGAIAANIKALEIVMSQEGKERVRRLHENANYFRKELQSIGFNTGKSETPMIPVIIGDTKKARELAKALFDDGIFVVPIVYPMVPRGTERTRNEVSAGHTREDLDKTLAAYEKWGKKLGII
ncbi:aminotransferase class I/II-fold pyridoxal phosphate-dependent enzyme [Fervidicoccus fontis]|uniref:8-amino-7-oxononanoate synthase n=1 Tax=Fervidicoccus fontis TaxID=683846 RepID=A0A2J6N800_9CREN|nr:aminotransferase class I/II-fold pyridoxal phosphate-dependent enzyme [Fervidicoccus fontis]MBE9390560.1 aminotransferase class I/II-fold pyridoxal phosphate-dependent enzyme [Fervidicoccus fontis]PMB75946.1 MAG: 8-amino-7-oxononanoate synthase [Fervidicoccus fontis]PMB77435.1 MAG: 8-amino-7-oxononanoate synthase [Fervidicoccus fontis]HEW63926.1 aminotransferase class I/II-fold pyridoxal phosphate-dependent enzyme [Fervidicoccus fontis]